MVQFSDMINYENFAELDLRIAQIESAEKISGSDKLVRLEVLLADEKRQIVAGIGKRYAPENLIGKQIVILANLEPRTLMGFESQGMLLAADSESGPIILNPESPTSPGSKVK